MEPYHLADGDIQGRETPIDEITSSAKTSYVMLGIIVMVIICLLIFVAPLVARTWICYCCNRRVRRYPFESSYNASRRRANVGLKRQEIERIPTILYCSQLISMNPPASEEINDNGEECRKESHGDDAVFTPQDPIARKSVNLEQMNAEHSSVQIVNRNGGNCATPKACRNVGLSKTQTSACSEPATTQSTGAKYSHPVNERKQRVCGVNEDTTTQMVGTAIGGDATTQTVITVNGGDAQTQTVITVNGGGDATTQTVITVNGGVDSTTSTTTERTTNRAVSDATEDAKAVRRRIVTCAICLVDFETGNLIRILPKCLHAFHVPCIDSWLSKHSTCPTCRSDLLVAIADKTSHRFNFQMLLDPTNQTQSNP